MGLDRTDAARAGLALSLFAPSGIHLNPAERAITAAVLLLGTQVGDTVSASFKVVAEACGTTSSGLRKMRLRNAGKDILVWLDGVVVVNLSTLCEAAPLVEAPAAPDSRTIDCRLKIHFGGREFA